MLEFHGQGCRLLRPNNGNGSRGRCGHHLQDVGETVWPERATRDLTARFQQVNQSADEELDDWADRILTLAGKAYRQLP